MRTILIKLHLYLGLVGGALLCVIALTGALYAYEPQLRAWWGEDFTQPTEETLLAPSAIDQLLRQRGLAGEPVWFLWPGKEERLPMWVGWQTPDGARHDFLLDPVTGSRLPRAEQARVFFHGILEIHRTLTLGEIGQIIVGSAAASLILLTISGLFIGVRRWRDAKRVWIASRAESRNRAPRVRWRFLHRIIGAWATPWLLIVPLTGMVWSFDGYNALLRSIGGPSRLPPTPAAPAESAEKPIALDLVWQRALAAREGDGAMRLVLPSAPEQPARFEWAPPGVASSAMRSKLYFDPATGAELASQRWEDFTAGEVLVRWAYPVHTGRAWGIFGQTLAFLGALTLPFFFGTGLYLYLARRKRAGASPSTSEQLPCKSEPKRTEPSPSYSARR